MDDPEADWAMDMHEQVTCRRGGVLAVGLIVGTFRSLDDRKHYVVETSAVEHDRPQFIIRTAKKLRLAR